MSRRFLAALAVACGVLLGCAGGDPAPPPVADAEAVTEPVTEKPEGASESGDGPQDGEEQSVGPLRRIAVEVYFPAAQESGLVSEVHEIFETGAPGDRAKQIVADLIAGPTNELALRALPRGTDLRQIYVLDDGTAYVDFSEDFRAGASGGSTGELLTVYSIVDSVVLNVPEIKRVGILVNGRPIPTLNGHLDLSRPLRPDVSLIVGRVT